jgi:hypothetical protein
MAREGSIRELCLREKELLSNFGRHWPWNQISKESRKDCTPGTCLIVQAGVSDCPKIGSDLNANGDFPLSESKLDNPNWLRQHHVTNEEATRLRKATRT